ncbi:MAG: putative cytoplasmic peptidase PepQ [Phycisphaerae bacterium]
MSKRSAPAGPSPSIARRLDACREKIQQKGVSGYLVTNRVDQFYLTGFNGEDGAALILPERVYLLTDGRFQEEAAHQAPWAKAVVRRGHLHESLEKVVRRHRMKTMGFQPSWLTVESHAKFRKALRPTRLVAMPPVPGELRQSKDQAEVAVIERAIRVAEDAFQAVIGRIRIGMTEHELAAALQHEMIRRGASGPSFPVIVAEGPNSSLPHAQPGHRRIREGSAILIDWGATVDHYRSDLTRVVFVRRIPPRFRRMYENVLTAQAAAIGAIRPGVRMCDVDAAARKSLKRAGMDRQFTHGTGHGLGLDIHEPPRLGLKVTETLRPGMVVTVEPGVYFPGIGGVRIEDDVLVTETGCRVLTRLPKDLAAMVIR